MPKWIASLVGKFIKGKLDLKEDKEMEGTKKWWTSRTIWNGVVTGLIGIYLSIAPSLGWPAIPEWIFVLLGGMNIYTRTTTTKTIG